MPSGTNVGSVFFNITSNRGAFTREMNKTASSVNAVFSSSMGKVAGFIGAAFSVSKVISFGVTCAKVASETQSAWQGLSSILNGQGKSFSAANGFIQEYISDGLVPLNNAVTAYKNLAARGYDTSQIQSVMNALKDSATYRKAAAYSYGDAITTATEGLKNENSVLVDNAGVTKNVAKMWEEYAKSIGTTRDKLTDQQKITAEVNGILAETKWQTGDAAKYADSFAGRIARLSASFTTLKTNIGNIVIPIANLFIPYIQTAMNAVNNLLLSLKALLSSFGVKFFDVSSLGNMSTGAVKAAEDIATVGNATETAGKKANKAKKFFAAYDEINVLNKSDKSSASGSGGGGGSGASPALNGISAEAGSVTDVISDKLKSLNDINFEPLKSAFSNLKNAVSGFVGVVKDGLKWAWDNVLKPFGKWTIEKALPSIINLVAAAFNFLSAVLKKLQPVADWLWKNFLQPIASWVGDKFISALDSITDLITDLTSVLNGDTSLSEFISQLSLGQSVFLSVAIAIGVVTSAVKLASAAFKTVSTIVNVASSAFSFLTSPVGIAIAAIAAIIAIIIVCVKHWDQIKAAAGKAAEWIQTKWQNISGWFSSKVIEPIKSAWNSLVSSLKPLLDEVTGAFKTAWEVIKLVWDIVKPYFEGIWEKIKSIFSVVGTALSTPFKNAWELIKLVWNVAKSYFELIWNNIKIVFSVVKTFFEGAFKTAWTAVKAIWDTVVAYFTLVWAGIKAIFQVVKSVLSGDFSGAYDAIKNVWDKANGYFSTVWNGVKNVFSSVTKWFSSIFTSAFTAVKNVFKSWGSFFSGLWTSIKNTFTNIGTNIANAIGKSVKSAINGVIATIEGTINTGINLINGAVALINKIPGVSIGSFSKLRLPRLASGGYAAANNPQLAIIGDNTREGEIVSPESKIREQVKRALDELGTFAKDTVQKIKLDIEVLVRYPDGRTMIKQINEAQVEEGRILLKI